MQRRAAHIRNTVLASALVVTGSVAAGAVPTSGAAAKIQGITGHVIKVGGIFTSKSFAGTKTGFVARIDWANKYHTLGKYKITLVALNDDGGSTQTDLTDVENLVSRQKVFALAPIVTTGFAQASTTYAAQHHVLYAGAGFVPAFCSPDTWGLSNVGCAIAGTYVSKVSPEQMAQGMGKKVSQIKWAFAGLDIPTGTTADKAYSAVVKKLGGTVVYTQASIPFSGGNLSPIVNTIEGTHPTVIWCVAGSQCLAFEATAKATGYTGVLVNAALYSPGILSIQSVATAIATTYVVATTPVLEEGLPYVKQMEKEYKLLGSGTHPITFGGEYAYMTADDLIALLKKAAPHFNKAHTLLVKGWHYTPKKGGWPLEYPFMFKAPTDCSALVKVVTASFTVKVPLECASKSKGYLKVPK